MDSVTHGLAGYVIVQSGLNRDTGRWGTIVGVSAAVFPDIDLLVGIFQGTDFSIKYHRYLTNSLFLVIPFSLLLAWLFVKLSGIPKFRSFFLIAVIEILAHTFLDLMTSYGTMILSPLSNQLFHLDWVFIVDPYLFSIFLFPVLAILIWRRKSRAIARTSVMIGSLYIALCGFNHGRALKLVSAYAQETELPAKSTAALPQPLSPFFWANYILTEENVYESRVNLMRSHGEDPPSTGEGFLNDFLSQYRPVSAVRYHVHPRYDDSPWVAQALQREGVQTFLWFARFPVARYQGRIDGRHFVRLYDLRFGAIGGRRPFVYTVIFDVDGSVLQEGYQRRISAFFKK
jgi:inner membrane protein